MIQQVWEHLELVLSNIIFLKRHGTLPRDFYNRREIRLKHINGTSC